MSALKKGQFVQIKNEFGTEVKGYYIDNTNAKTMRLLTEDNSIVNWSTYTSDTMKIIEDRVKSAKELDVLARIGEVKTMHWHGESLGSDPEFFIIDGKTEEVIPAFDFLPSAKDSHGAPFWDGFQSEFNISAGSCLDQRVSNMQTLITNLLGRAKEHNKRAVISPYSTVEISEETFGKASPSQLAFGCSPSFNVYKSKGMELDGTKTRIRSAGGHLHFGLPNQYKKKETIESYVKVLDKIVGVACVALFQNYDNPLRRQFYGLAGEYRTPGHGLEYRTLTNAWCLHPRLMYIVFELARKAIALEQKGLSHLWDATEEEVIECINNCDVYMAKNILLMNEDLFRNILHSMCYQNEETVNIVFNTIMQGMEALIPNPNDVSKNWGGNIYNSRISNLSQESHPYLKKRIKY